MACCCNNSCCSFLDNSLSPVPDPTQRGIGNNNVNISIDNDNIAVAVLAILAVFTGGMDAAGAPFSFKLKEFIVIQRS